MYKFIVKKIDFFIPLLIIAFSFFVAYHNVGSGVINYIDHNFPFYFSDYLSKLFYTWTDYIYLGSNHSTNLVNSISYYSIFYIFEKIGLSDIFINRLEHIIPIFCIIYFTYLFLQSLLTEKINISRKLLLVLASTFFLTNIAISGLFTMGLTQGVFALSGITLVLFSLRKYGVTHKKIFLLPMVIGALIITSFNLPYNVISMIAVSLLAVSFSDIEFKLKIKNLFLFFVIWLFVNSFWIMPMFYSIFIAPPYNLEGTIENASALEKVMQLSTSRYTLDQLLKLGINLNLVMAQNNDHSLILNYFASKWFILLAYITVICLFVWHLILRKEKSKLFINPLFLIGLFIVFIFLAKGLNQPFGELYRYLFDKTIFFKMFRDGLKWMIVPFLVATVLMANILMDNSKKLFKLIVILFLLANLFPWIYDGLMGGLRAYSVPSYYFTLNNYYKNTINTSDKRAIILDSVVAPTSFEFDIKTDSKKRLSNNILKFISPFPPVDLFSNGGGVSSDYIKNIFANIKKTDEDIIAFQKLGATHIYHQRDLERPAMYNYTDKYFNKVTFGKIDVYEIKKDYILPKVFLSNNEEHSTLSFKKINSTKYILSISGIKNNLNLNFLYTIDQNWKLYLMKNSTTIRCDLWEDYTHQAGKECINDQKFFEGEELTYLYRQPVFDNTHHLANDYANQWTIDPDYIKQNLPKDSYKENPDGSIDISLTLYFKPQSYFYLGLIISSMTLFGCFIYLSYGFTKYRKERGKRSK